MRGPLARRMTRVSSSVANMAARIAVGLLERRIDQSSPSQTEITQSERTASIRMRRTMRRSMERRVSGEIIGDCPISQLTRREQWHGFIAGYKQKTAARIRGGRLVARSGGEIRQSRQIAAMGRNAEPVHHRGMTRRSPARIPW